MLCALAVGLVVACEKDDDGEVERPPEQVPDSAFPPGWNDRPGGSADGDAGTASMPAAKPPLAPLQVQTQYGPVAAIVASDNRVFRGVHYAAPPVGELRYAAPKPPEPWTQLRAVDPAPCPQIGIDGNVFGNEDCLTLDVWTPRTVSAEPLPVMVWIHGGGFTAGSGFLVNTRLPARGVIVVAINYRLGPLGFLAHEALGDDSGNAAIRDMQLALQWVHDNIAAFGGNRDSVTIFGESAGGSAVCSLLWSQRGRELFDRAIIQSGALCGRQSRTLAEGEAQGAQLAEKVGCSGDDALGCLRAKPLDALLDALPVRTPLVDGASWGPVEDGMLFERDLPSTLADGSFAHKPAIIGTNEHEGDGFLVGLEGISAAEYEQLVRDNPFFGQHAEALLRGYSIEQYGSPFAALAALVGDRVFNCPARRTARAYVAAKVPVYVYLYDFPPAWHASELGPLFTPGSDAPELRVSNTMNDVWALFAKTGSTRGVNVLWREYTSDPETSTYFQLGDPARPSTKPYMDRCALWDELEP